VKLISTGKEEAEKVRRESKINLFQREKKDCEALYAGETLA